MKLVFNETGRSTLCIQGVTFNDVGLGLFNLTVGIDFLDGNSANKILAQLDRASTRLRAEAAALGSTLSIVQISQDFNKSLINVLQTGASYLTLAYTNEEAANSQPLSTQQSIAVSALALANQSQASVLQLLRLISAGKIQHLRTLREAAAARRKNRAIFVASRQKSPDSGFRAPSAWAG